MAFTWEDLIDVAEQLLSSQEESIDTEAYCRSSINRSYYGAYKTVTQWLEDTHSFEAPKENAHKAVLDEIRNLQSSGVNNMGRIRLKLDALRGTRVNADYEYAPRDGIFDVRKAQIALDQAREICSLIPN